MGTSAAWHDGDEPASGFVLELDGHRLLLECGTGVLGRMNRLGIGEIDDIIVTHAHADHCYDLVPLRYDYEFGNRQRPDGSRPSLHVGTDTRDRLARQVSAFTDDGQAWWEEGFDLRHLASEGQVGPWRVRTIAVEHFIPALAVRLDAPGSSLTFSSDLGAGSMQALAQLAEGTDVLVCEAALPSTCSADHGVRVGHLDPLQAAQIARAAGAKRLLLTHVPAMYDPQLAVAEASELHGDVRHVRSGDALDF